MTRKGNRGGAGRRSGQTSSIDWTDRTTAMIRNIPSCYTQKDLLAELDARGWDETYDFFYLPFDQQKKTNCGYCFMNFKDPSLAAALHSALDGAQLAKGRGRKRLQVVAAVTQGYHANADHFQHSAVLNHHRPEHAPLFLKDGGAVATGVRAPRGVSKRRSRTPPLAQLDCLGSFGGGLALPVGVTTLTLHPIPAVLSQPMLYVELCRAGVGYLVDFLHITDNCEAVVNFESPAAASHAAQVLQGMSMLGSPGLAVGVAKIQGCGANIVHYATQGVETDPKRAQFSQSFEYPVPQLQQLHELQPVPRMLPVPPEMNLGGPRLTPSVFLHALSAVYTNVEGSLLSRSPKTLGRFASLDISLEESDAACSATPAYSATPEYGATPEFATLGAARRSPLLAAAWPQPHSPERTPGSMRRADMERALQAGFPDMLSSPACVHLAPSRGPSSDSHASTPADGSTGASTPPASPCGRRLEYGFNFPRVPA